MAVLWLKCGGEADYLDDVSFALEEAADGLNGRLRGLLPRRVKQQLALEAVINMVGSAFAASAFVAVDAG